MRRFGLLTASAVVLALLATGMSDLVKKTGLAWGRPVESAADFQLESASAQGLGGAQTSGIEAASANVTRGARGSSGPGEPSFVGNALPPQ